MTHAPARKRLAELRSQRWFAAADMRAFAHRQRIQQMGLRREHVRLDVVGVLWPSAGDPVLEHVRGVG